MKRWFLIFALLVGTSFAQQLQQNFPVGTIPFNGVPSGSCGPAQNAVNTATGVYYFCNNGVWTPIANNTFPTANTVTESTNTVTATTVSGNWPPAYQPGASISETGCSVGGYNITAVILSGGGGGTTLTFTDPTGSLGAGSGCTANLSSSSGGTITGVTAGTGLTGGGTTGNVTVNVTLPVASATSAAQVNGAALPLSKNIVGTDGAGHIVDTTGATLGNNTTGNANTATNATNATNLASAPSTCGTGIATTGITANGTPVGCFTPSGTLNGMVAGEPVIGQSGTSAVASPAYVDAYALNVANGGTWDICKSITQAFLALPNNAGFVEAAGFSGTQVCSVANATGSATNGMIPNANCQLKTQGGNSCTNAIVGKGKIHLGAVNWYLPVVSTEAGSTGGGAGSKVNYERVGTIVVPAGVTIEGVGNNASGAIGNQTNIRACQSSTFATGCTAPATTEIFQISSIVVTQETAAPGRQYMAITTAAQSDIVAGEPIRISGAMASGNANMVDFNNSYTPCESSAYSDVVTDPSCGGGAGGLSTTGTGLIYAPVSSGIVSITVTAVGSGYGTTPPSCSLPAPANAGGVQATCIAQVSGGSVSGIYLLNRGVGYASGATAGAVTLSGNATATFQTIPSSCTRGTNVDCGYVFGELPLFQLMNFAQGTTATTNQGVGVSMGDHLQNLNIDCENVPSCVGIMARSIQEGSEIKDNWFGNSPDRDFDMHGFQSQNTDVMVGNRDSLNSLANRQQLVTAGAYTFGAGTLTLTVGANSFIPNGILYIWGSPANIGCAKSVNTTVLPTYPTYIPLPVISENSTQVVLDDSGTNCATSGSGTDTYNIGEICEPGKEAIYWGDVGPHGLMGQTLDISGCANTGGFPVAANTAFRMNVNSTSADFVLGGHAEGVMYGILAGDSGPFRGVDFIGWAGIPTPSVGGFGNTNQAGGQYQSEQGSSAIKIRSEFNTTTSGPATTDYMAQNIQRNNSSGFYFTVNDDNPVNGTLTDGAHVLDVVTSLYAVDTAGTAANPCVVQLSTASSGNYFGCGANIPPAKGGTAVIFQGLAGGTAVGFTQNIVTVFGNWYNQNLLSGLTHLNWGITVADNTANNYDFGLYGPCAPAQAGCPLAVHLGATAGTAFAASGGLKGGAVAILPAIATLLPGNYYIAGTTNCASACATLTSGLAQMQIVTGNSVTASAGGALPATMTVPAQSLQSVSLPQSGIH